MWGEGFLLVKNTNKGESRFVWWEGNLLVKNTNKGVEAY